MDEGGCEQDSREGVGTHFQGWKCVWMPTWRPTRTPHRLGVAGSTQGLDQRVGESATNGCPGVERFAWCLTRRRRYALIHLRNFAKVMGSRGAQSPKASLNGCNRKLKVGVSSLLHDVHTAVIALPAFRRTSLCQNKLSSPGQRHSLVGAHHRSDHRSLQATDPRVQNLHSDGESNRTLPQYSVQQ